MNRIMVYVVLLLPVFWLGVVAQRYYEPVKVMKVDSWPPPACWKTADVIMLRCMSDRQFMELRDTQAGDEFRLRPGVHDLRTERVAPTLKDMFGATKITGAFEPYGLISDRLTSHLNLVGPYDPKRALIEIGPIPTATPRPGMDIHDNHVWVLPVPKCKDCDGVLPNLVHDWAHEAAKATPTVDDGQFENHVIEMRSARRCEKPGVCNEHFIGKYVCTPSHTPLTCDYENGRWFWSSRNQIEPCACTEGEDGQFDPRLLHRMP